MTDYDTDSDCESFYSLTNSNDSFRSIPSLVEHIEAQFSDVPDNFNVVHINAQSIPAHFSDMLATFDCKNIHAIFVSESWLKPCLPSTSYSLPGFKLIRNDRVAGGGGGVAIYLRSHITYSNVHASAQPPPSNAGEHLFIEVELNHTKVLLGVYYCPSLRIDFFSAFESLLIDLMPSYSHTIIMGDFNTCLLKNDSRSFSFRAVANSCNLSILPLDSTHHLPNCIPSLLDLAMVSSRDRVAKHGQCPADMFSYHDLIFLSYKIRPPKASPKILMQRNFGNMDLKNLCEDANIIDWSSLYISNSVNEKVDIFTSNITRLYDMHAPVRPVKIKHRPAPWLTNEIKRTIGRKAAAKYKYKIKPSAENLKKYVSIRNHCNKVCRDAQRQHIHKAVQNGDPAKVWKFLKTLGVGKIRQETIPKDFNIEVLNQHFSASSNFDQTTKASTLHNLSSLPAPCYSPFLFDLFTDCDVKNSIISITSNAVGSDGVSRNMILPILDEILPVISHILNYSLISGVFPASWKNAQITPLPKKINPKLPSDYRPISILPFLSKVLERLVHNQISTFLNKNNILNPLQSGFRPGHSTTTALVNITDDIRSGMDRKNLTVLALLDFSNAFNTVDFDVLLCLLRSLNISPTVTDWFRSYLCGRQQRICIENSFSSWSVTTVGVPQGGVLSPLLFAIFINSISNTLISSYHLFADDLQIYLQSPLSDISNTVNILNQDLEKISTWSKSHGLTVNPAKSQVAIIGSTRLTSRINKSLLPQIVFEGTTIPISESVKNLGLIIDANLTWGSQLQEVSRKIFASANSLRRLRNFLPTATKIALANSILLPILDYADVSYLDLAEYQLDKLERLQNVCIRFIFGLRKYDHVSQFRMQLKWLPIRCRRNAHIVSLLYSILFNPSTPSYLKKRFIYVHDTHNRCLRSSENLKLAMPQHSTTYFTNSFTATAIRLWNALPEEIRRCKSLNSFKVRIKKHYLNMQS